MADNRDFKNYDLEKEILINKKDLIEFLIRVFYVVFNFN